MKVQQLIQLLSKLPADQEVAIATTDTDFYNEDYSTFQDIAAVIPKMNKKVANSLLPFDRKYSNCAFISTHTKLMSHGEN